MATEVIQLVRNDTQPQVRFRITESGGTQPLDLTDKIVRVFIRRNPREGVVLQKDATVFPDTGKDGYAYIVWKEGDLDLERGSYEFEVEVSDDNGFRQTCFEIFEMEIRDEFS